jgi:hypothetical protein
LPGAGNSAALVTGKNPHGIVSSQVNREQFPAMDFCPYGILSNTF